MSQRSFSIPVLSLALLSILCLAKPGFADPVSLSAPIHSCDRVAGLNLEGEASIVPEGPNGQRVLRIDGSFNSRIDLKPLGLDPHEFDLLKFEVKTPRGAFLRFSLENYPSEGELSHWYVFDGTHGPSDWKTVWVDLRLIEEIKLPGQYKGLSAHDPALRGLQIMGHITDSRRSIQEPDSTIWIRNIRFAKKAIDLDWDQLRFEQSSGDGKDLVYAYPVEVRNLIDRPVTVNLSLLPVDAVNAKAAFSQDTLSLGPKEAANVTVRVWLPAAFVAGAKPLHCEQFEARAVAVEIEDSEVTILRSADPIHLNVTVPIPERQLALPFYPHLRELPQWVFNGWDETVARTKAAAITPDKAAFVVKQSVLKFEDSEGSTLHSAIASAGMLYSLTGEKQYLDSLRAVFRTYADEFSRLREQDVKKPYRLVSDGLMARNVLQFCFKFGGGQRPPYFYSLSGNGSNGTLFGHMHAFDAIAADLSDEDRQFIIDKLFLPVMIQVRNHYFGLGNQQCNSNNVVLYSALLSRHWPTAGWAYASEHGLLSNIKWTFDDDGLCREGHYQEYTINPILHTTEALYGCGIDLYDQRLYEIVHSKGAEAIGQGYRYDFARFLDETRFANKKFAAASAAQQDGYHLSASTLLKQGELEVAMNWGTHIFRGSHDRCSLSIRTPSKGQDVALRRLAAGGGAYNHSTFGQSTIIVNEQLQNSVTAEVVSYDVEGPVQHVSAVSDKHYPGSVVTRTFALLGRNVLVVDRVRCEKPSTVDWCLVDAGSRLSVPTESRTGSWTDKKYDNRIGATFGGEVSSHEYAKTSESWTEGGRLTMLGAPATELFTWQGNPRRQLMVRRRGVTETDFIALFSLEEATLAASRVRIPQSQRSEALGITVRLASGKTFHMLLNGSGQEAVYGPLKSSEHFATDFE
jgi:hypothetical protein